MSGNRRLQPIVGRLLEKRPGARPESIDELFAELSAHTGRALVAETAATRVWSPAGSAPPGP